MEETSSFPYAQYRTSKKVQFDIAPEKDSTSPLAPSKKSGKKNSSTSTQGGGRGASPEKPERDVFGLPPKPGDRPRQSSMNKSRDVTAGFDFADMSEKVSVVDGDGRVRITDLCLEDKAKIGLLVKRLAEEKEAKEKLIEQLTEHQNDYEKSLQRLQAENQSINANTFELQQKFQYSLDLLKNFEQVKAEKEALAREKAEQDRILAMKKERALIPVPFVKKPVESGGVGLFGTSVKPDPRDEKHSPMRVKEMNRDDSQAHTSAKSKQSLFAKDVTNTTNPAYGGGASSNPFKLGLFDSVSKQETSEREGDAERNGGGGGELNALKQEIEDLTRSLKKMRFSPVKAPETKSKKSPTPTKKELNGEVSSKKVRFVEESKVSPIEMKSQNERGGWTPSHDFSDVMKTKVRGGARRDDDDEEEEDEIELAKKLLNKKKGRLQNEVWNEGESKRKTPETVQRSSEVTTGRSPAAFVTTGEKDQPERMKPSVFSSSVKKSASKEASVQVDAPFEERTVMPTSTKSVASAQTRTQEVSQVTSSPGKRGEANVSGGNLRDLDVEKLTLEELVGLKSVLDSKMKVLIDTFSNQNQYLVNVQQSGDLKASPNERASLSLSESKVMPKDVFGQSKQTPMGDVANPFRGQGRLAQTNELMQELQASQYTQQNNEEGTNLSMMSTPQPLRYPGIDMREGSQLAGALNARGQAQIGQVNVNRNLIQEEKVREMLRVSERVLDKESDTKLKERYRKLLANAAKDVKEQMPPAVQDDGFPSIRNIRGEEVRRTVQPPRELTNYETTTKKLLDQLESSNKAKELMMIDDDGVEELVNIQDDFYDDKLFSLVEEIEREETTKKVNPHSGRSIVQASAPKRAPQQYRTQDSFNGGFPTKTTKTNANDSYLYTKDDEKVKNRVLSKLDKAEQILRDIGSRDEPVESSRIDGEYDVLQSRFEGSRDEYMAKHRRERSQKGRGKNSASGSQQEPSQTETDQSIRLIQRKIMELM